jgi:hypothetical protein
MCRTIWFLWRPLPGDDAHDSPVQGRSGLALLLKARLRKVLDQPGLAERAYHFSWPSQWARMLEGTSTSPNHRVKLSSFSPTAVCGAVGSYGIQAQQHLLETAT